MAMELHWFLPSHGDGRELAERRSADKETRVTRRRPTMSYLTQVAMAADELGFASVLTPTGLFCEDAWLVAAALAERTSRLKFMIALRPGMLMPPVAAQMAATFQRISGNRLLLNVVTGGDPDEQRRYGDWLDHDERYARAEEFLAVLGGMWGGQPYDFEGAHYHVRSALLTRPPKMPPTVFLGGSSPAAQRVAAARADVYLAWGETPAKIAELLKSARRQAESHGRTLRMGTRLHVIARDTSAAAWAVAEELLHGMDDAAIEAAQRRFSRSESEGQRRAAALHGGDRANLEVYPNVWAGYGLLRPGAGAALVGSHEEVADRLAEYHAVGADHFILSGQPHLEEAYNVAEGVLPLLRKRGLLT